MLEALSTATKRGDVSVDIGDDLVQLLTHDYALSWGAAVVHQWMMSAQLTRVLGR